MSRPGDWRCPQCNNHNFKFRTSCNRCQAVKPDDATIEPPRVDFRGKVRPGDWTCCGCENRNFAFRDVCNRCDLPRYVTQTLFSASLLDDEHETSCPGMGLQLLMTGNPNAHPTIDLGMGSTQADTQSEPTGHHHGKHGSKKSSSKQKSPGGKGGDSQNWRCNFCWNLNYEFRVRCNRCQMTPATSSQIPLGSPNQLPATTQLGHVPNSPAPKSPAAVVVETMPLGQGFYSQSPNASGDPWGVQVRT